MLWSRRLRWASILASRHVGNLAHQIDLRWLLKKLGSENVTSLLVEGGGEVNASFLLGGFAQRVAFFYAPKILGGRDSRKGVAGDGAKSLTRGHFSFATSNGSKLGDGFAADGAGG